MHIWSNVIGLDNRVIINQAGVFFTININSKSRCLIYAPMRKVTRPYKVKKCLVPNIVRTNYCFLSIKPFGNISSKVWNRIVENEFENVVCKMAATLYLFQSVGTRIWRVSSTWLWKWILVTTVGQAIRQCNYITTGRKLVIWVFFE